MISQFFPVPKWWSSNNAFQLYKEVFRSLYTLELSGSLWETEIYNPKNSRGEKNSNYLKRSKSEYLTNEAEKSASTKITLI